MTGCLNPYLVSQEMIKTCSGIPRERTTNQPKHIGALSLSFDLSEIHTPYLQSISIHKKIQSR